MDYKKIQMSLRICNRYFKMGFFCIIPWTISEGNLNMVTSEQRISPHRDKRSNTKLCLRMNKDASTWRKKEAAWVSIQNEFNAQSGGTFRSTKTLKIKYEGLKRTVRKKSAAIRSELHRTGGGKNTAPPLDNAEEQIKCMISLSTDGLESIYDSDMLPQTQESQDCIDVPTMADLMEIPFIDRDTAEVVEATQKQVLVELVKNECETLLPTTSTATDMDNMNDNDTRSEKCGITPSTSNKKWDGSSRRNLKSRKHPASIANPPKKTLFHDLTQAKLELVQLQKEFLETEIIVKKRCGSLKKMNKGRSPSLKKKSANGKSLKKVNGRRSWSLKKRSANGRSFKKMNERRSWSLKKRSAKGRKMNIN